MGRLAKGIGGLVLTALSAVVFFGAANGALGDIDSFAIIINGVPVPGLIVVLLLLFIPVFTGIMLVISAVSGRSIKRLLG